MKYSIVLFTFLYMVSACDSPRKTRDPYSSVNGSTITTSGTTDNTTDDSTSDSATDDTTDSTDDSTTTTTGFENCNLNYQYFNQYIGNFAICQNSLDDTKFKIKISQNDYTEGTCFVPIRRNTNGTSFKLGIAECVNNEAGKEYTATLSKENQNYKINGVMVLKARALSPYMMCMNAIVDYNNYMANPYYGSNNIDSGCYQSSYGNSNTYAQCVCNKFVSYYKLYYNDDVSFTQNN